MESNVKDLVSRMTLEEKASLCSGLDAWHTKPVPRLGIPSIRMTDGPVGVRKQTGDGGQSGVSDSVPATCFPSGSAMASSWDRELFGQVGQALGEECLAEDVSILLGPAVNIKRSPLGGRDFEYYSEDPHLASELGAAYVEGVQSRGVGTSLKHFAANSQETNRLTIDERIDERALREIYLSSFEGVVRKARPWTVMCAYNRINGAFCSENRAILTSVLKEEWGHEGFVMSDWGAVDDRAAGLAAGLDLEMPSSEGVNDRRIVEAVKTGRLSEEVLNRAVERLLAVVLLAVRNKKPGAAYNVDRHHALASRVAQESIVLLQNGHGILPLGKTGRYAVIGRFAETPRYQGGGSSHIHPTRLEKPLEELRKAAPEAVLTYAPGFDLETAGGIFSAKMRESVCDRPDEAKIAAAVRTAAAADAAVVFLGLPETYESEGFDRLHMRLPEGQIRLLEEIVRVQKHVVVVLQNGSPVEMPWAGGVDGVVECYLGGQGGGSAVARVLFGDANPCGKLAETFPQKLSDTPGYLNFPGDGRRVEYREGIFVGYRYYEAKKLRPLFPFGHGLSYTRFSYEAISVNRDSMREDETLTAAVRVRNVGGRAGKEIVELYIRDPECSVLRPAKELKGFAKVALEPGEAKTVSFELGRRAFAFYSDEEHRWKVESGRFEILAGPSSAETPLSATVTVEAVQAERRVYGRNTTLHELSRDPQAMELVRKNFPGIDRLPLSMLDSIPVRSLGMFGGAARGEQLLRDLTALNSGR